jgi:hypothetical protein
VNINRGAVRREYSGRQEAKLKVKEISSEKRCRFPIPDIDLDAGSMYSLFTSLVSEWTIQPVATVTSPLSGMMI